eukprot:7106411-Heterocapsa_arctica.AAC.1
MDSESASDVGECYTSGAFARDANEKANVMALNEDETGRLKNQEEEISAKLLHLRDSAKPPQFSGADTAWPEFKFRFKAVMSLLGMGDLLKLAAATDHVITVVECSAEVMVKSRLLYL